ncbi:hypothetical protein BM43_573 [Burkholderia gladioli]|uniref:Uncharacterized protein n=1 Tax=Burkholderia gladioli TaxID=28095 RepID=A0AAW3F5D1_BURGA|nr:hypothetical protein BM43_573 [Burkholderia gladioli]KGC16384.1 hypothetical protein DM48_5071 [Burkholderia gladioli]SPU83320.1 Uncharacterised protein [Burkholderia gladioli]
MPPNPMPPCSWLQHHADMRHTQNRRDRIQTLRAIRLTHLHRETALSAANPEGRDDRSD